MNEGGPDARSDSTLERGFRLSYGAGLLLCVAWPLALQALLGTAIAPGPEGGGLVRQLGYTFTGLVCAGALFVARRWARVRARFREVPPARRGRALAREVLLYAVLFQFSALFGVLYYLLGGPQAERYARGFLALAPIMFFAFVPRLQAWRRAANEE
jgi:hypothetical protein